MHGVCGPRSEGWGQSLSVEKLGMAFMDPSSGAGTLGMGTKGSRSASMDPGKSTKGLGPGHKIASPAPGY